MSHAALAELGRSVRAQIKRAGVPVGLITMDLEDGGVVHCWPDGHTNLVHVIDAAGSGAAQVLESSADVRTRGV
jgi:hypothetical protein